MDWARILAFVTGMVDQELLARNEYLAAENRILKAQLKGRLKLSDAERATLAEIGRRLGRKALAEVASVARPDTVLAWYRCGRPAGIGAMLVAVLRSPRSGIFSEVQANAGRRLGPLSHPRRSRPHDCRATCVLHGAGSGVAFRHWTRPRALWTRPRAL